MRTRPRPGRSEAGFSLTEVAAALAVTAILAGIAAPLVLRAVDRAKRDTTQVRLERIAGGLRSFYRDHARFPSAREGLDALVSDPGSGRWRGPYLPLEGTANEALSDGRGTPMRYAVSGSTATVTPVSYPDLAIRVTPAAVVQEWIDLAQRELAVLAEAAELYRRDTGAFPAAVSDLVPSRLGEDYRVDPWGRAYRTDATRGLFYSAGPDGAAGTSDDVYAVGLAF